MLFPFSSSWLKACSTSYTSSRHAASSTKHLSRMQHVPLVVHAQHSRTGEDHNAAATKQRWAVAAYAIQFESQRQTHRIVLVQVPISVARTGEVGNLRAANHVQQLPLSEGLRTNGPRTHARPPVLKRPCLNG
jgi:hypothetical protein